MTIKRSSLSINYFKLFKLYSHRKDFYYRRIICETFNSWVALLKRQKPLRSEVDLIPCCILRYSFLLIWLRIRLCFYVPETAIGMTNVTVGNYVLRLTIEARTDRSSIGYKLFRDGLGINESDVILNDLNKSSWWIRGFTQKDNVILNSERAWKIQMIQRIAHYSWTASLVFLISKETWI